MPGKVKGSKQQRMVVVPHRPWRRVIFFLLVVSGIGASAMGGFGYGYYKMLTNSPVVYVQSDAINDEMESLRADNDELRRQITHMEQASIMDQRANQEVQAIIGSLRDRVVQLEQGIVYYRQVVSEETGDTGLIISRLDINATMDPDRYRYKLVMRQQDADGDTYLTGHVNVNLVGRQNEELMVFPLRELSEEQSELDIRLRFKFFQNIEGELVLPEGFRPERVQIAAMEDEPIEKTIDQDFSWVVDGE